MSNELDLMHSRLRRLEDLDAIRQLFVNYGYYLDHGLFEDYGKLFADDGEVLLGPIGRAVGPTAIQALMEKTLGGRSGSSYHLIANPIIHLEGDRATTDVTWAVVTRDSEGKPTISGYGRHKDVVVRDGNAWKFKRREGHVDIPSKWSA